MTSEEDPVFTRPEAYGIENLDAPGEPDREKLPEVTPVPGTGRQAREEHMRRHDEEDARVPDPELRERREREEVREMREQLGDATDT